MSRAGSLHSNLPNLAFVHQNRRMNRQTDMWAYWSTVTANKRGWVTNQQTEWVTLSLIEQHDKDNATSQVAHCCQCQSEMEFSNEGLISTNLLPPSWRSWIDHILQILRKYAQHPHQAGISNLSSQHIPTADFAPSLIFPQYSSQRKVKTYFLHNSSNKNKACSIWSSRCSQGVQCTS